MADPKAPEPDHGWTAAKYGTSLDTLRALLSAHGLHIVSEADRKVLEACAALKPRSLEFWADYGNTEELKAVAVAERNRRTP